MNQTTSKCPDTNRRVGIAPGHTKPEMITRREINAARTAGVILAAVDAAGGKGVEKIVPDRMRN